MKKGGFWFAVFTLVFVLGFSYVCTEYIIPYFRTHYSYSETTCLTDRVTSSMDVYDIARMYRDNGATVEVIIRRGGQDYSYGSGVCVASNGYKTSTLETEYTAAQGSYIATNYHVISPMIESSSTSNFSVHVTSEKKDAEGNASEGTYPSEILWYNKDLDSEANKLDYEQIFVIGTPLQPMYLNRLTVGNIASNKSMTMMTVKELSSGTTVVDNLYEDVIDIYAGITPGNSGGGVFDANGYLIGLATLGSDVTDIGGNFMNGAVPIYPVMKALDKIIVNKETSATNKVYDLEKLNIKGYDENEAGIISYYSYYLDGQYYTNASLNETGYYINSSSIGLSSVLVKSVKVNDGEETFTILDRNDLIYLLLSLKEGDKVTFNYKISHILGSTTNSKTITLA